ncbi:odorant receptor Or1 [Leptinotarsa decemlineata]|uniref:odorant receptor Or1 n=1 Tax=Leptinotarsa decemlineata TaxID=7539 RepID=UPI003D30C649
MKIPNLVEDSFKGHLFFMKIIGIYPSENFFKYYTFFAYLLYFLFTIPSPLLSIIKLIVLKVKDIGNMCDSLSLIIEIGVLVLKVLPFKNKPDVIKRSIFHLNKKIFSQAEPEQLYILLETVATCRKIFAIFLTSCLTSLFTWALKVLLYEERAFPIDVWLPFDPFKNVYIYLTVFFYIFLGVGNAALCTASIDTLMAGLINHGAGQIKLLKDTLKHLGRRTDEKIRKYENLSEFQMKLLKEKLIYRKICSCVAHYEAIHQFVRDFERTYSSIIFAQFTASVLVLCISCLQILLVEPLSATFFAMVIYVFTILAEIFLYCYYGTILYEEVSIVQSMQ